MSSKIIKTHTDPAEKTGPGKIIEKEVLLAHAEARRIVEAAEARAEGLVAAAEEKAAEIEAAAEQTGYEKSLARWEDELAKVAAARRAVFEEAKPQILELGVRVAEKILRNRLEADPQAILPMVEETLEAVRAAPGHQLTLRVHSQDAESLADLRRKLVQRNRRWESLAVVRDDLLTPGGVRVETDFGTIDASIETQLRAIEHILLEGD